MLRVRGAIAPKVGPVGFGQGSQTVSKASLSRLGTDAVRYVTRIVARSSGTADNTRQFSCAHPTSTKAPSAKATPASAPPAAKAVITSRATSFHKWYADVISAADLIDYSAVRGCMILKPRGYALWEAIKQRLDGDIKRTGHANAYFPMLLPLSFLSREAAHVEGFAQECAVVTHHRVRKAPGAPVADVSSAGEEPAGQTTVLEPDPYSKLQEPLVIRPTSETIIWDAYRRWISTHKDLPLLLNQWANVMRWEMRTRPFLRTSEFLWQEGHTAHATEEEAVAEANKMARVYRDFLQTFLAVPVVLGHKSQAEKFAGANETMTCEAMMGNGWALQAATSHFLGTNFAKAFDVQYTDAQGNRKLVWATSWGASTRMIGAVIMSHGDDNGLVLPPTIAPVQVGIIPIVGGATTSDEDEKALMAYTLDVADTLRGRKSSPSESAPLSIFAPSSAPTTHSLRVSVDEDLRTPPGARFYALERSGCPLRIEIGKKDMAAGVVTVKPRIPLDPRAVDLSFLPRAALEAALETPPAAPSKKAGGSKDTGSNATNVNSGLVGRVALPKDSSLPATITKLLEAMHNQLRHNALERMKTNVVFVRSYEEIERRCDEYEAKLPAQDDQDAGSAVASSPSSASTPTPPATITMHPWLIAHLWDDPSVDAKLKERKLTVRCFPMVTEDSSSTTWQQLLDSVAKKDNEGKALPATGKCVVTGKEGCRLAIIGRAF
jgi:prolyl-tRNA synthetase